MGTVLDAENSIHALAAKSRPTFAGLDDLRGRLAALPGKLKGAVAAQVANRWPVSIRTLMFCGCMSLTFMTVLVGLLSLAAYGQLDRAALEIYDDAFIPMNYLRSAHTVILEVSRDLAMGDVANAVVVDQLRSVEDALDGARERAMSARGEAVARQLQAAVSDLRTRLSTRTDRPDRASFAAIERTFDVAVQVYAADGLHLRGAVERFAGDQRDRIYGALGISVLIALAITLLLSRAIVPALRQAVGIASAIAGGGLDTSVPRIGPRDTRVLLDALAVMQDSIVDKMGRIQALLMQQASSHQAEIALQHSRFEAALNNMTLGLCMFDDKGNLLVQNRRFGDMFPALGDSAGPDRWPTPVSGGPPVVREGTRTYNEVLKDGRTIAVSEEPLPCGGRVAIYEDITERQLTEARLRHMARHDALTGLPNRVLFREHLERATKRLEPGSVLAVLCIDLDRFKAVNDTLGHPLGDALLRAVAERLLGTLRAGDLVVRLGGDEFAIVRVSKTDAEPVGRLAAHVLDTLKHPFDIAGHSLSVSASIGIVESSDPNENPDDLLIKADLALYAVKAQGGAASRPFAPQMYERLVAKRQMEIDLRTALVGGQFQLFYQPLLSTADGSVVAFEALLRWHHPERGMVSPAEFIPVAEEAGLIVEIGAWVLDTACRDAAHWPETVKVAVNLSPLQFNVADLVTDVRTALFKSGLPARRLELEITESIMLQETEQTLQVLYALRALGVSTSMDDFGTGYSSLSYLSRFPFDKVKIDKSFVRDLTAQHHNMAIVRAVISIGRSLQMSVVAEGVETEEQMRLLAQAGCQQVQGYLFSRPQPLAAVPGLVAAFTRGGPARWSGHAECRPGPGDHRGETAAAEASACVG